MAEQIFLGKFMGGCFTWGLMMRSCKKGGGGEKLTLQTGDWIWKTPSAHFGVWDFMYGLSSFLIKC